MTALRATPADAATERLRAEGLTLGYDNRTISTELSVRIPDGSFTVIIGPNACGKSTLLRALSRLLKPAAGQVHLDGRAISSYPAPDVPVTLPPTAWLWPCRRLHMRSHVLRAVCVYRAGERRRR